MASGYNAKSPAAILAELRELFGPPPVLSSENVKAYDSMTLRLLETFRPRTFLEALLIRQLADANWDIARYVRQKTLGIERVCRVRQESEAQRDNEMARRKAQSQKLAARAGEPPTEVTRMSELDDDLSELVPDVDEICLRQDRALDHARALEATITYHERLDDQLHNAMKRQGQLLDLLERCQGGLGECLRKSSEDIIDLQSTEYQREATEIASPPLGLTDEGKQ